MIDRGKINKKLNEVKPTENTKKNSENFLRISPIQKKVSSSHKLLHHVHVQENSFKLKEDSLKEKL